MARVVFMCMLALTGLVFVLSSPIQGGVEQGEEVGTGNQQSPIDIETAHVQCNLSLGELKKKYTPATATLQNKGYEIQVVWSEDAGSLEIEGVEYRLAQCHWHHPSEHTINNEQYPLELHMVHLSDDDKIAVIGILYQFGPPDFFITTLEASINNIANEDEIDLGVVDPNIIGVGSDEAYYRYSGSLTTSPYTEGVTWSVIKQVRTATPEQVNSLRHALHGMDNSRPVQPLNGRVVQLYDVDCVDVSEMYKAEQTLLTWSS